MIRSIARALLVGVVPGERVEDVLGDFDELSARALEERSALGATWSILKFAVTMALAFCLYRWRERDRSALRFSSLDLRLAGRLMARQPVLHLTSVAALASGIALTSVGTTMLDAALHSELQVTAGARFMIVETTDDEGAPRADGTLRSELAARAQTLEHVGAITGGDVNLELSDGVVESVTAAALTPTSWPLLEAVPLLGRGLVSADGVAGAPLVAVLRESLWRRSFGGRKSVLGEPLEVAGQEHLIVGVVPDAVGFPLGGELWSSLGELDLHWGSRAPAVTLFGVHDAAADQDGVSIELSALASSLSDLYPGRRPLDLSARSFTSGPQGVGLLGTVLTTVLVLLLLVIAANVANLILARTTARTGELRMRSVLGAPRIRLVGQLSLEVGLLGLVSAIFGLAGGLAILRFIDRQLTGKPFWLDLTGRPETVVFAVLASLLICIVCGVAPALRATSASGNLQSTRATLGVGRWGAALMVLQMSVSVALLSGALVMARSYSGMVGQDLELPRDQILTARIYKPQETIADEEEVPVGAGLHERVLAALDGVPGVEATGIGAELPRMDAPLQRIVLDRPQTLDFVVPRTSVSPGFLEALDARVLEGRLFGRRDVQAGAAPVAVVNELFARRHLGSRPVGQRFRELAPDGQPGTWHEVIGVVPDLGLSAGSEAMSAGYYVPLTDQPNYFYLVIRSPTSVQQAAGVLRRRLVEADPLIQVRDVKLLEHVAQEEIAFQGAFGATLSMLGFMALALSLCGVYAVVSMAVSQRRREIGIRVALGASRMRVLSSVARRSAIHLACGGILGLLFGTIALRLQDQLLAVRLPVAEAWILPAVLALFAVAGALASLVPAIRALEIHPAEALNSD